MESLPLGLPIYSSLLNDLTIFPGIEQSLNQHILLPFVHLIIWLLDNIDLVHEGVFLSIGLAFRISSESDIKFWVIPNKFWISSKFVHLYMTKFSVYIGPRWRLLSLMMTWIISTSVHWSWFCRFQILINSPWFPTFPQILVNLFQDLMVWNFHVTKLCFWRIHVWIHISHLFPDAGCVWRFTFLFLLPRLRNLSTFLLPLLKVLGWIVACVSPLFPDTGQNTALSCLRILQVIGVAQFLRWDSLHAQHVVRYQIQRSWFRHHKVHRFRLRHHRTFSRIAFLSSLLHGTLLSVWKKAMATGEHPETYEIQQIENLVPLITCMLSVFLSVVPFPFALKPSTEVFAPYGFFRLWVGSRNSWSRPDNFAVPFADGKINSSPFCGVKTSFSLILRGWISDASIFPSSSRSATRISPFQIRQRSAHIRGIFLVARSWRNRIIFNHCPKGITGPLSGSPNRLS